MSKTLTVEIKLNFGGGKQAEVKTNGVPWSLILESLQNLSRGMAEQIVKEATEDVGNNYKSQEEYLDAVIQVDRMKLEQMLKK